LSAQRGASVSWALPLLCVTIAECADQARRRR
jgi:hypothetical protein